MHIGWNRIWKVLLGCACVIGSIVLLACGQVGWGIAALEAAVLLLALQYAPRAARLRKTWWFVELVLVLAVTVGYAGFAAVRAAQTPASAVVITTERSVPPVTPVPAGADRHTGADARTRHGGGDLCRQPQGKEIPPAVVPVRRQDQGREPRDL